MDFYTCPSTGSLKNLEHLSVTDIPQSTANPEFDQHQNSFLRNRYVHISLIVFAYTIQHYAYLCPKNKHFLPNSGAKQVGWAPPKVGKSAIRMAGKL